MYPCLISIVYSFSLIVLLSNCVTVDRKVIQPTSTLRIELRPILIRVDLNDIAVISAPVINNKNFHYYLNKPSGEVIKLDLFRNDKQLDKSKNKDDSRDNIIYDDLLETESSFKIFNVNNRRSNKTEDLLLKYEKEMKQNDFMIGPLNQEDRGNWVLSIFYDRNGEQIEFFQVISIEITESIPVQTLNSVLSPGSIFKLRFAYPINYLESCELRPPESTFDRCYTRQRTQLNRCGYIVKNVTKDDEGTWTIIGVGKIIHVAKVDLKVI